MTVDGFCKNHHPEDQSPIPALVEALEDILEALPKETSDADWWPDELKAAVRQGNEALAKAAVSELPADLRDEVTQ